MEKSIQENVTLPIRFVYFFIMEFAKGEVKTIEGGYRPLECTGRWHTEPGATAGRSHQQKHQETQAKG